MTIVRDKQIESVTFNWQQQTKPRIEVEKRVMDKLLERGTVVT